MMIYLSSHNREAEVGSGDPHWGWGNVESHESMVCTLCKQFSFQPTVD